MYSYPMKEGRDYIMCNLSRLCVRRSDKDQSGGSTGIKLGRDAKGNFT